MEDAPGQAQVLLRGEEQQVPQQAGVLGQFVWSEKQHPARLRPGDADLQGLLRQQGVSLGKNFARAQAVQHAAAAPEVVVLYRDPPGQDQSHRPGPLPGGEERLPPLEAPLPGPHLLEQGAQFLFFHPGEQGGTGQ